MDRAPLIFGKTQDSTRGLPIRPPSQKGPEERNAGIVPVCRRGVVYTNHRLQCAFCVATVNPVMIGLYTRKTGLAPASCRLAAASRHLAASGAHRAPAVPLLSLSRRPFPVRRHSTLMSNGIRCNSLKTWNPVTLDPSLNSGDDLRVSSSQFAFSRIQSFIQEDRLSLPFTSS